VLKRALVADPNQRYADAEEMRGELEPSPKAASAASLPPADRIAAALSSVAVGGGLVAFLNQLVNVVAAFGSGSADRPGLWMAVAPPALGLAAVALLRQRWRRRGWTEPGPASHLPQTTVALRLSLLALALVAWKAAAGVPGGWPSWLDSALHGAQAGGLTAGAWGLLECRRRHGGGDEPFLWLGGLLVLLSVTVDGLRAMAGAP